MIEMLGVLVVIGVLSVAALAGFTYAMNRHKANETIHDVMLRATNVPMIDEYYVERTGDYEWKFAGLPEDGQLGSFYRMHTVVSDLNEYVYRVVVSDVPKRVCRQVLSLNPTDIDAIYVEGDEPTDEECPNELNTMAFYFDEYGTGGHLPDIDNPNPDEPGPGEVTPPLPPPTGDCLQVETYYYGDNCEYTAECCADEDSSCPPTCTPKECPEPPQCNECEQYVYDNDGCPINCEAKRCEVTCEDSSLGGIDIDNCGCPTACACTENADCAEGFVCKDGVCEEQLSCTTDEDCPEGLICTEGICHEPCPEGYQTIVEKEQNEVVCCTCQEELVPFEYSGTGTFCTEHNRWIRVTRSGNTLSLQADNGWMKGEPEPNYVDALALGMINQYDEELYPASAGYCREGRVTLWSHNFGEVEDLLFVAPFTVKLGGIGCNSTTVVLPGTEGWMKAGVCPVGGAQTATVTYDITGSYVGYVPRRLDAEDATGYTCQKQEPEVYQCIKGN